MEPTLLLGNLSALVVDDDAPVARMIARAMARAGIGSTVCTTLSQARAEMLRTRYDVLLLDLFMNGETTRFFYEKVVEDGRMPVIVVSASSDVRHRVQALEAGCYDYITKPFDESEFVARIRAAVKRHAKLRSLLCLGNGGNPRLAESAWSSERMQSGALSLPR